ncbi:MAG: hypothetical protein U5N55_10830 [Cypionkella sp.]|nr:hypothetical protein [Cypionkella sp.]
MATNDEFLKVVVKDVVILWPRLDKIYRFNSQTKRVEPCAANVTGAGWSVGWEWPTDEAKRFFESMKAHYNARKALRSDLPEFSGVFGMKKDPEKGVATFTAKRKAVTNKGELQKPPEVVVPLGGGKFAPLEDKGIWSGSVGGIRLSAFPTIDPEGKGGISLAFDTVVVSEAKYGGASLEDDFGDMKAADTGMGNLPEPTKPVPQTQAPQQTPTQKISDAEF